MDVKKTIEPDSFTPPRMVNEYVYCPRLAYLEWVQGKWEASVATVEGKQAHRRVDRKGKPLPEPDRNWNSGQLLLSI